MIGSLSQVDFNVIRGHLAATGVAAAAVVLALVWFRQYKSQRRGTLGRLLPRAARRKNTVIVGMATVVLSIRVACLPIWEKPQPSAPDEFSYLLSADTFASGRAANRPHPLWEHFEARFVLQQPTYASIYPPAQGLALALGLRIAGHPWWGVWLSVGLMCAALCWMLQGWLPPVWALFAAAWACFQLGLVSYWMNSYWGGAMAAFGGALLLGSLPRLIRNPRGVYAVVFACGAVVLFHSRPYEGSVLILASGLWLAARLLPQHQLQDLARRMWPGAALVTAGVLLTGWYFWRVTGNPLRMPGQEYIRQYAASPAFVWQSPPPEPAYRHPSLREANVRTIEEWRPFQSFSGAIRTTAWKLLRLGSFYLGPLFPMLPLMAPLLYRSRTRFLVLAIGITLAAVLVIVPMQTHYLAPVTGAIYAVGTQSIRKLWLAGKKGNPFGYYLGRAAPVLLVIFCGMAAVTGPPPPLFPPRANLEKELLAKAASHLVIVHYEWSHNFDQEWVYNRADISRAPIIWARDMGVERNRELEQYFPGRFVWLLDAGSDPAQYRLTQLTSP